MFGVPSGLFISFTDEDGNRETTVSRVHPRGTHLLRVDAVNQLSRRLAAGELAPDALMQELELASQLGTDTRWWRMPAFAALSGAGFAVMFGGDWCAALVAAFCAALTQLVPRFFRHGGSMAGTLLGSMCCTLLPLLFVRLTGLGQTEAIIAGALMPLVPGLSMTNAVSDILRGDMVSGTAHGARALMTAALVAGGALVGAHLYGLIGGVL